MQDFAKLDAEKDRQKLLSLATSLYFFLVLMNFEKPVQFELEITSDLPISAGMGSSASFNVCIAAVMLIACGAVSLPDTSKHTWIHAP